MAGRGQGPDFVEALARGLDVIACFGSEKPTMSLSDVAQATGLELRVSSRLLLGDATFRIAPGDRVGLVGRNGAGKTTLTRVLSGEHM